jgi:2-polyprenyl-6-methoxyphenol hydroxylase-like FAD-dependent oxidoreductase
LSRSRPRSVVVLGAGVAGLAATLALAREGHRVTLVERDYMTAGNATDAFGWERKGIAHFLQPHAFTPRGRKEMIETFPDVYEAILAAGAWDLDLRPKIRGGTTRNDDSELLFLAVRRPLIEWAFRRAILADDRITVLGGTKATGLVAADGQADREVREAGEEDGDGPNDLPRVIGVQLGHTMLAADLVVDAMGRRTTTPRWIAAIGGRPMTERSNDCSIIYYCRYYRLRDAKTLPDVPSIPGPRGDLGYAAFTTFPGDNRTFGGLISIPPGDRALKSVRDVDAFEAAVATMPALRAWADPEITEPITDVLSMGSLQNTIRAFVDGRPPAVGLIGIGDAVIHTDPALSLGLSFSLIHARHLATVLRERDDDDVEAIAHDFDRLARPEMEERFDYVSAIDDTRTRLWAGERIDFTHADGGAYPFFTYAAAGTASMADGDLARALVRRNQFLDPLSVLDEDPVLIERLEALYAGPLAEARWNGRAGPPRDQLIEVMRAAQKGSHRQRSGVGFEAQTADGG